MSKTIKIKKYWAEIHQANKAKLVWFDTEEQGKDYMKKIGQDAPIHDIEKDLPF